MRVSIRMKIAALCASLVLGALIPLVRFATVSLESVLCDAAARTHVARLQEVAGEIDPASPRFPTYSDLALFIAAPGSDSMFGDLDYERIAAHPGKRFHDVATGENWLISAVSLEENGAYLVGAAHTDAILVGVARWRERAWLTVGVALGCAVLLAILYAFTLTLPVAELAAAVKEIAAGNFRARVVPRSRDELRDLSLAFNEMAKGLEDREVFRGYFDPEIAPALLSRELKRGGERREVTVLFCDLRDFTRMSERLAPEGVMEMLNEYLDVMVPAIRSHGGVVDKYIGDGILAIFGLPLEKGDEPERAARAALAMLDSLAELNVRRRKRGDAELRIGIGLNAGKVIAGNLGTRGKMEYTVIGDAVNVASRLEALTKTVGTDILVSRSVYEKTADRFVYEACDDVKIRGKSESIAAYELIGHEVSPSSLPAQTTRR